VTRNLDLAMAKQKRRLATVTPESETFTVALADIDPDPQQPRRTHSEPRLRELTESVAEDRVRFPVTLREHPEQPGRFMLVTGERRWLAAKRAGQTRIPAVLERADAAEALELQLISSALSEGLHHLERGAAVLELLRHRARAWNLPVPLEKVLELMAAQDRQEPSGKRKSRADDVVLVLIAQRGPEIRGPIKRYAGCELRHFFQTIVQMRLRAPDVFEAAVKSNLGVRVANELVAVNDPRDRADLTKRAVLEGWSHAQTRRAVKAIQPQPKPNLGLKRELGLLRNLSRTYSKLNETTRSELNPALRKIEAILKRHESADMSAKKTAKPKTLSRTTK
jgi:ParB-like chromosome segregation protein Spo0J